MRARQSKIVALPACNYVGRASRQLGSYGRIAASDFCSFADRGTHDTGDYCQPRRPSPGRYATNSLGDHSLSGFSTTGYGAGML